jgi:hypothetical protein
MREDSRGFLLCVAVGGFCFPKRNCAFRKIKMQVTLRRDSMIMCRYSSSPSTSEVRGRSGLCLPSSNPLTGATLTVAINGT